MGSKDGKDSIHHSDFGSLYKDHSNSAEPKLSESTPDTLDRDSLTPVIRDSDVPDSLLISYLSTENGQTVLHHLGQNSDYKNLLSSFSHDSDNPELSRIMQSRLFEPVSISSQSFGSSLDLANSDTPISTLLDTLPGCDRMLSTLLIRIQSNSLVDTMLQELSLSANEKFKSFLQDTLVEMDREIVVPEILEERQLNFTKQEILSDILQQISEQESAQPGVHHVDQAGQEARYGAFIADEHAKMYQLQRDKTGKALHLFADSVENIFQLNEKQKLFKLDWFATSLQKAQHALADFDLKEVVSDIKDLMNKEATAKPVGIDLSNLQGDPDSLVTLAEHIDEKDMEFVHNYFQNCSDSFTVNHLIDELLHCRPEQRPFYYTLLFKIPRTLTVPVILERQFELTDDHATLLDILKQLDDKKAAVLRNIHDEQATIREQQTQSAKSNEDRDVAALIDEPPRLLSLLQWRDGRLLQPMSDYLSSDQVVHRHLPVLLEALSRQATKSALDPEIESSALTLLSIMGQKAVPVLLEYQTDPSLQTFVNTAIEQL
ncbi:hypothetical protein GF406_12745 [candidate division KSB1 bacterium]|nr:hypothetical protein [candidate division KSB1 bacterium]